jgi:hypothetical protein
MVSTIDMTEQLPAAEQAPLGPQRIEFREGELVDPALIRPNLDHIVTEDGAAVDNLFSEKQMRLLTEPLFSSWPGPGDGRPFVAMGNVGLFYGLFQPPLVPDTLLSLDVRLPEEVWEKHHRSYFTWEYGKPPDVVIEIVSNTVGEELGKKLELYAQVGVLYYIVYDPHRFLRGEVLRMFDLERRSLKPRAQHWMPDIGLGVRLWQGRYEDLTGSWLRWCLEDGSPLPTGAERIIQERERAEQERERAEQERERAEQAYTRAERLAARLRELGLDPESENGERA